MGGYRPRRWLDEPNRWPRCGRRLRCPEQLHVARWSAHRLRPAAVVEGTQPSADASEPRRVGFGFCVFGTVLFKDEFVLSKSAIVILCAMIVASGAALADGSGDPAAVKDEDGKYFDKEGN